MSESDIKREIMEYLNKLPMTYARVVQVGGIAGRTSQSKGISDIIAIVNGWATAIEVKSPTGKLSDEQKEFLYNWKRCGGISIVARSLADLISALNGALNWKAQTTSPIPHLAPNPSAKEDPK